MITAANKILSLIQEHKTGKPVGITSVCSANEYVIKAAVINARKNSNILLIESTSNQVDQFGGYTGMKPDDFRNYVFRIAGLENFSSENLILGGDHLGPNVWQNKKSGIAMQYAKEQISAYLKAGYTKIHLDASMKCVDDEDYDKPLDSGIIAERAAELCKVAEDTYLRSGKESEPPVYVIGTDVPPPGGAKEINEGLRITTPNEVAETISLTRQAFINKNIENAWERVTAVVVQPGVEFGDNTVFDYNKNQAEGLVKKISNEENLVYEAHSTDYQSKEALRQMVENHFAILKVGPWLTFAFREAVFALEMIEKELFANRKSTNLSRLTATVKNNMIQNPKNWKKYYCTSDKAEIDLKLKYSFSDRIRYYWNNIEVKDSLSILIKNLSDIKIPLTLLSQFLPRAYDKIRNKEIGNSPEDLIINQILIVLSNYNYATNGKSR